MENKENIQNNNKKSKITLSDSIVLGFGFSFGVFMFGLILLFIMYIILKILGTNFLELYFNILFGYPTKPF